MAGKKAAKAKKVSMKRKKAPTRKPQQRGRGKERFTAKRKARFLTVLMETGMVNRAIEATHCSVSRVYQEKWNNSEFAQAWKSAAEVAAEVVIEGELMRRAIEGVTDWKTVAGQAVKVRKKSDILLLAAVKAGLPDKYKDTVGHEHSGSIDLSSARERLKTELSKLDIELPQDEEKLSEADK